MKIGQHAAGFFTPFRGLCFSPAGSMLKTDMIFVLLMRNKVMGHQGKSGKKEQYYGKGFSHQAAFMTAQK